MEISLNDIISDSRFLSDGYIMRDGFYFTTVTHPANVYDGIIVELSSSVWYTYYNMKKISHSVEEYVDLINKYKIEKAVIIADNINFVTRCPSLKYLNIIPSDDSGTGFDYSPLYSMPEIKYLTCKTIYGRKEELSTTVDCGRINGIEDIHVVNSKYQNFNKIESLKGLGLTNYKKTDLTEAFCSPVLDTMSIFQSKINSLEGIQQSRRMQCLYLYYNRSLQDISALRQVKATLRALRIENCPSIMDFSVLEELENLELLELSGSNELPDLNFIKKMKSLKTFTFSMNVKNGDLTPCLNLSYVYSEKNRKHYNLKDIDLPKLCYARGNEDIEEWRRLE